MGISAMAIPLKRVRVSALEYDADIDTGAIYGIKTDKLSKSSDILNILNARLDGFLESRYFTTVNSSFNLYSVWPTPRTITNHVWNDPVPVFKMPAGILNGSKFSLAASVRNVNGGTTYIKFWNITQDFYLGPSTSTTSSTFVCLYTAELTVGPASDVLPGDIIGIMYYTTGTSTGEIKDVAARGVKTVTFKEGTISWSL